MMPHTNKGGGPSWRKDHDPFARPLGCDGKYGKGGAERHRREGTQVCDKCRASAAHWARERRRGGLRPRQLKPCGTPAAAHRHRQKGETVDLACLVAETNYRTELRSQETRSRPNRGGFSHSRRQPVRSTQALRTLAGAMDAEQLPEYTTLELHGGTVIVRLPQNFYRRGFEDEERWADTVRQMFPGGKDTRLFINHVGHKANRVLASDKAEYRVQLSGVTIILFYVTPHEHVNYRGEIRNGKPRWRCTGCGKAITTTESRRLGLLPELPARVGAKR